MKKKTNNIDLKLFATVLGTKIRKTDSGLAEFVKFKTPTVKGMCNPDASGGMSLSIPGTECFTSNGTLLEQVEKLEALIKAYNTLTPDLKKIKSALKKAELKAPEKPTTKVKVKSNAKVKSA